LKEDSIIRFDTVNRKELSYKIIDVNASLNDIDKKLKPIDYEWKIKETLGKLKQARLIDILRNSKTFWDSYNLNSGIIFCPHKGWYFGVTDRYKANVEEYKGVYDAVSTAQIPNLRVGSFMGSDA